MDAAALLATVAERYADLSVTYEPLPYPGSLMTSHSPVVFWIDAQMHLVTRAEGEMRHRFPADEEMHTSKVTDMNVVERITAPSGRTEREFSIPVA